MKVQSGSNKAYVGNLCIP